MSEVPLYPPPHSGLRRKFQPKCRSIKCLSAAHNYGSLVRGRSAARAEDAQGTPTQSHISPSILVYEGGKRTDLRSPLCGPTPNGGRQFETNYFTEMCSGSEAGSYLRLIDFVYHSTLGLRVIKKKTIHLTLEP